MSDEQHDGVMPEGKWEFDSEVADCFDDMLERSIPQYDVMRKACFDIGWRYVRDDTFVVDVGCSRGAALQPFIDKFGARCRYLGVEVSDPMIAAAKERFDNLIVTKVVEIRKMDLREEMPRVPASVVLCVLTLQFTPIEYRLKILKGLHDTLEKDGVLVIVEKVLGATADLDLMMVDVYYQMKKERGYSQDAIDRKKLSLEGVLVPVTAKWNEEMLRMTGFNQVDCFWRWCNFCGWVAVKE